MVWFWAHNGPSAPGTPSPSLWVLPVHAWAQSETCHQIMNDMQHINLSQQTTTDVGGGDGDGDDKKH